MHDGGTVTTLALLRSFVPANQSMARQEVAHSLPYSAGALPVDDADRAKSLHVGIAKVLIEAIPCILCCEAPEVELRLDWCPAVRGHALRHGGAGQVPGRLGGLTRGRGSFRFSEASQVGHADSHAL